jgi:hypothetical protein
MQLPIQEKDIKIVNHQYHQEAEHIPTGYKFSDVWGIGIVDAIKKFEEIIPKDKR